MATKLEFTSDENNVMQDAAFFIHKKHITTKVIHYFGDLNNKIDLLKESYNATLPALVKQSQGKISKGENYESLPFIILDNPRVFTGGDIFAIRTMFWWGNHFSCTLHLSGIYFEKNKTQLKKLLTVLNAETYFICTGNDEWQHHFRADNYTLLKNVLNNEVLFDSIFERRFFKVAFKSSLNQHHQFENDVTTFCEKCFTELA